MMIQNDQVLGIFRDLSGHRGCTKEDLDLIESQLGVKFPKLYHEMMRLDADRLLSAQLVAPIHQLQRLRQDAMTILLEDGHAHRLETDDVVFAWDDIYAFYWFKAGIREDPPVNMFHYYDSQHNWMPVIAYDTLTSYFVAGLRRYLNLS